MHLPQRNPIATDDFTIFSPKIVGASTKSVFQQWWPSIQRARPSCAGLTSSGGGMNHVFVSQASRCVATRKPEKVKSLDFLNMTGIHSQSYFKTVLSNILRRERGPLIGSFGILRLYLRRS